MAASADGRLEPTRNPVRRVNTGGGVHTRSGSGGRRVPLWLKLAFSAFVIVIVPYYWVTYTPWNFLYFCDVALVMTLVGLWTESPLLISLPTVGIALPQMLWVVDFLWRMATGGYITGMTSYMFDAKIPLLVRGLSSFHGWLPFVLLWLVWRLGYDRRAFGLQSVLAIVLLLVGYFVAPAPPPSAEHPNWAVNINYAYGLDDKHPQTSMAPGLWLLLMMVVNIVGFYLPTHLLLQRFCLSLPKTRSATQW